MKAVGRDIASRDRWQSATGAYADEIATRYHQHRLAVIQAVLPDLRGKSVVDFGCGDGVVMRIALQLGARQVRGIDLQPAFIELARKNAPGDHLVGGVEQLARIERCDVLVSANVLAYLTDTEEQRFYAEAARMCDTLVVTHSNSLFDLFTLNAFTAGFFRDNFGVDPSPLLTHPSKPERVSYNVRENPLAYGDKLAGLGFELQRLEYINHHDRPPLLSGDDALDWHDRTGQRQRYMQEREYRDTLQHPSVDRWKLMFQCSTFAARAVNVRDRTR